MPAPEPEFQLLTLPSPDGLMLCLVKRTAALPAGASLVATLGTEADIPGLRRALADRIGPCSDIQLDVNCCARTPGLLPQIKTALVKLSRHDTRVSLRDAAGNPTEAPAGSALAQQLNELRQAIAALRRISRLRPQDSLRWRWQASTIKAGAAVADIAVLGAGIAGVTIALELLRRGKHVTLIDAQAQVLSGASAQATLACHPQFSRDQDVLSQLSQRALSLTLDSPYADLFVRQGRLTPALSSAHAREQEAMVSKLGLPADMLCFVDAAGAAPLAQWPERTDLASTEGPAPCAWGGLWTALGASLPVPLLRARVADLSLDPESRLRVLNEHRVQQIEWHDGGWQLSLQSGAGPVELRFQGLVLACGAGMPEAINKLCGPSHVLPRSPLPQAWEEMGGQTFLAKSRQWRVPGPAPTVGGPVTLQRIAKDTLVLGSSYYEPDAAPPDHAQWQALQHKLARLPGMDGVSFECLGMQPGVRCYTPDRMPLIGPLLDPQIEQGSPVTQPGARGTSLWMAGAFGSRGLLWAHLAAQLIADLADGKAPGLGLKALKSVDALRYQTVPQSASPPRP